MTSRISCTILFCFSFLFLAAQEDENASWNGKWVLGGNLSMDNTKSVDSDDDETKNFLFNWSSSLGKHVNERWLLGVEAGVGVSRRTFNLGFVDEEVVNRLTLFSFGIFSRYHFAYGSNWGTYVQPRYSFLTGSDKQEIDGNEGDESDISGHALDVSLGGFYHLNERWRITLNIGGPYFQTITEDNDVGETSDTSVGLDMSLSNIAIGMELLF